MRSHGVPNFPDPIVTGTGVGLKVFGRTANSPQSQSAEQACQKLMHWRDGS